MNKKEITKEAQRDLFLFTEQLYWNSITNATSNPLSCNISVYSFSSKTHHFLSHSQLFYATTPLFIANSFIIIHFFSYIFLTAKASFLHCNSYAFTLQFHYFYNLNAMLFNPKLQLFPHHFATTLRQKQLVNIGYICYIFCKCYLIAQKLACYLPQ